jgi:hypothetical protein
MVPYRCGMVVSHGRTNELPSSVVPRNAAWVAMIQKVIINKRGGIVLDKKKVGNILGVTSLLPVIISIIIFYVERGPNADVYFVITIYGILSIIGILFAVFSWLMTKRFFLPIISLIGNGAVLAIAFLLLLAMGISEPKKYSYSKILPVVAIFLFLL